MPKTKTVYELTIALNPLVGEYNATGNILGVETVDKDFTFGIATARQVLRSKDFEDIFQGFELRGSNNGATLRAYFPSQRTNNTEIVAKVDNKLAERFRKKLGIPYGSVSFTKLERGAMADDSRKRSSLFKIEESLHDKVDIKQPLFVEEKEDWEAEYDSALPDLERA